MLFENKVVLITGGASGIGQRAALDFAREGASVMIADVNADGGAETIQAIEREGGTASYITTDVTDPREVQMMVQATQDQFDRLDIAVNSAGISGSWLTPTHEITEENYQRVMDINVRGVWLCMKHQIPVMLANGGGSVINLASVAGLLGVRGGAIYSASKHAVIGLTKSAALDYASKNIRVNALCPSFTETPMVTNITDDNETMEQFMRRASPMRRLANVEEIASAILWLASEQASFVNGAAIPVDGGLTAL